MDENDLFVMDEELENPSDLTIDDGKEDLDFEEGNEFVVSMHCTKEKSSHCGCGVIVGDYLVTAGHVAKDKTTEGLLNDIFVLFRGNFVDLHKEDIVYDGRENKDVDEIHDDLIIYLFNVQSPLCLNDDGLKEDLLLYSKYFDYDDSTDRLQPFKTECNVITIQSSSLDNTIKWSNCFIVNNPSAFKEGNSGCPVYRKQDVYGILLKEKRYQNSDRCYTFLSAGYIIQKINEYEHQL